MAKTVVGSFDTFDEARRVVDDLERNGFTSGDINLIGQDRTTQPTLDSPGALRSAPDAIDAHGEPLGIRGVSDRETTGGSIATGAVTGGVVGGAAGLLASLAGIAVPGIGTLLAAGPIVAALAGAGVGAVAGGLIGALRDVGVPDSDAEYYAEAVRRGGALVALRADDERAGEAADLMRRHGAIDIESRVAEWRRSGWQGTAGIAAATTAGDAPSRNASGDTDRRSGMHAGTGTGLGAAVGTAIADAATAPMAGAAASDQQVRSGNARGSALAGSGSGAHLSDTMSAGGTGLPQTGPGDDRRLRESLRGDRVHEDEHAFASDRCDTGDPGATGGRTPTSDRTPTGDRPATSERPSISDGDGGDRQGAARSGWDKTRNVVREGWEKTKDAAERAAPGDSDRDGR